MPRACSLRLVRLLLQPVVPFFARDDEAFGDGLEVFPALADRLVHRLTDDLIGFHGPHCNGSMRANEKERALMRWIVFMLLATAPASVPASGGAATPKEAARRLSMAFAQPTRQGLRDAVAGKT